jgi:hypothetical protein
MFGYGKKKEDDLNSKSFLRDLSKQLGGKDMDEILLNLREDTENKENQKQKVVDEMLMTFEKFVPKEEILEICKTENYDDYIITTILVQKYFGYQLKHKTKRQEELEKVGKEEKENYELKKSVMQSKRYEKDKNEQFKVLDEIDSKPLEEEKIIINSIMIKPHSEEFNTKEEEDIEKDQTFEIIEDFLAQKQNQKIQIIKIPNENYETGVSIVIKMTKDIFYRKDAWVGLFSKNEKNNQKYISFQWVSDKDKKDILEFISPYEFGEYEFRFFPNSTYIQNFKSKTFVVGPLVTIL